MPNENEFRECGRLSGFTMPRQTDYIPLLSLLVTATKVKENYARRI